MSLRGELVIECDCPDCQAEHVIQAAELKAGSVYGATPDWAIGTRSRDVCPQCQDEIDAHTRCERCLTKLEPGYICGDCHGGTGRDFYARAQGAE